MTRLTELDLAGNQIGSAGAALLAPSLAVMKQLRTLVLGDNGFGSAGAASLAPSLAPMAQLTSLDERLNF